MNDSQRGVELDGEAFARGYEVRLLEQLRLRGEAPRFRQDREHEMNAGLERLYFPET